MMIGVVGSCSEVVGRCCRKIGMVDCCCMKIEVFGSCCMKTGRADCCCMMIEVIDSCCRAGCCCMKTEVIGRNPDSGLGDISFLLGCQEHQEETWY